MGISLGRVQWFKVFIVSCKKSFVNRFVCLQHTLTPMQRKSMELKGKIQLFSICSAGFILLKLNNGGIFNLHMHVTPLKALKDLWS